MRHRNHVRLSVTGPKDSYANGVALSDRLLLTCAHVFADRPDIACPEPDVFKVAAALDLEAAAPVEAKARLVAAGWFPLSDLAILHLDSPVPASALAIAEPSVPVGRLTGSAWDHDRPGLVDFRNLRCSDDGFATISGVLGIVRAASDPSTRPGYSGFPIFDANRALAAIHQKADDYDLNRLVTASARMIRTALRLYAERGGPHPLHIGLSDELPDIDDLGRVLRRQEYDAILASLFAPSAEETNLTAVTSLSGDGGFGKTTLAQMIYEDRRVRDQLGSTLGWITVGREAENFAKECVGLAHSLNQSIMGSPQQVARQLAEMLTNRRGLIVFDDVWDSHHLEPFRKLGPDLRLLVTTRNRRIADLAGQIIDVEQLAPLDADRLISRDLPVHLRREREALAALARRLHSCAQWIDMANALLKRWCKSGTGLEDAVAELETGYREEGFEFLESHESLAAARRADDPEWRRRSIAATQRAALKELPEDAIKAYMSLAVLPEDVRVPQEVVRAYWEERPSMCPRNVRAIFDAFEDLSLVERPVPGSRGLKLHDTKLDWLTREAGPDRLRSLHGRMADALEGLREDSDPLVRRYARAHQVPHARRADRHEVVNAWLSNVDWVEAKLAVLGIEGVRRDHETKEAQPEHRDTAAEMMGRVLIWDAPLLSRTPKALRGLVAGRIGHLRFPGPNADWQDNLQRQGLAPIAYSLRPPGPGLRVLDGHDDSVWSVAFSPDGATVLTGSQDGAARLWRASDGAPLAVLKVHGDGVTAAAFSPDGTTVFTGFSRSTARLWRAGDGAALALLEGHAGCVSSVAFGPDGATLLTGSADGTARLWRTSDGAVLAVLEGHRDAVHAAAFSPDGATVLTGSEDGTARLWHAGDGAALAVLEGHDDSVWSVAFSSDGSKVLTRSGDGTARLWRASDGAALAVLEGHSREVTSAAFSPDGATVLTGSEDGTARLWHAGDGAALAVLKGHGSAVTSVAVSPDGATVLTGCYDGTAWLWRVGDSEPLAVLKGHGDLVRAAAFSPDGATLLTGSEDGTARLWRVSDGATRAVRKGHDDAVHVAAFSPDGATLLTGSEDGTARLWRASDGAALAVLEGHGGWVRSAVFSPDGAKVLTRFADGTTRLWRAGDGAALPMRNVYRRALNAVAVSPDGAKLLTSSVDGTAWLWRVGDSEPLAVLKGHKGRVTTATFSPDGATLLTAAWGRIARLWRASDGAALAVLEGHRRGVMSAAFSPDGATVLTGSYDCTARLWRASDGAALAVLEGHEGEVHAVAFSPDGATILTASADQTARLWRAGDGTQLSVVPFDHAVTTIAVSTDRIAVGDGGGAVHFFRIDWVKNRESA